MCWRSSSPASTFATQTAACSCTLANRRKSTRRNASGSAEVEQGFFLYMLYYLARVGRYVRRGGVHHVRHYVKDTGKPWNKVIDEELVVAAGPDHPPICNRRTMHRYSLLRTMRLARE